MTNRTHNLKKRLMDEFVETPIMPLFFVVFIAACIFIPNFATILNVKNYLLQSSDLLIIACGVTFVVLNGGIDFSVTSTLTLGSVIGAYIMALSPLSTNPVLSMIVAIVAMVTVGAIIGAINGIAVSKLKMPSFIATLATQLAFSGVAIVFTKSVTDQPSIYGLPEIFFPLGGEGKFYFLPILISFTICLFSYWLLKKTLFGRQLYAIGVNPKASFISGLPVKRVVFRIFLLSGIYAGIASVIATSRNQVGVSSLGDKLFISIIACIIVGGTSVSGGFGGFKQTLFGVLFITLLNNTMNLLGVEWYVIMIEQGILILAASLVVFFLNRNKKLSRVEAKNG